MNKSIARFTLVFALIVIGFATWQLFSGNFVAACSSLPFLLIIYLFVLSSHKKTADHGND